MKLIVGLGNPGPEYKGTRHNVGFEVADELAKRWAIASFAAGPVNALIAKRRDPGGDQTLLAKPLTFMNASGEAVGALVRYYKIETADLMVVVDEVQLPLARLRAGARGSAGGHNGLKSLTIHLGEDFSRLRIGVGRGDARRDLADHVLSRFEPDERGEVERAVQRAADAAELFVSDGIDAVMARFNAADDQAGDQGAREEGSA